MENKDEEKGQEEVNLSEDELDNIIADAELSEVSLEESLDSSGESAGESAAMPQDVTVEEIKEDFAEINKDAPGVSSYGGVDVPAETREALGGNGVGASEEEISSVHEEAVGAGFGEEALNKGENEADGPEKTDEQEEDTVSLSSNEMDGILEDVDESKEGSSEVHEEVSLDDELSKANVSEEDVSEENVIEEDSEIMDSVEETPIETSLEEVESLHEDDVPSDLKVSHHEADAAIEASFGT